MNELVEPGSIAGRAIEMVEELMKLGRMSRTEAQVVYDLVCHPHTLVATPSSDGVGRVAFSMPAAS